jgi:alpha-ribazole phosphatase
MNTIKSYRSGSQRFQNDLEKRYCKNYKNSSLIFLLRHGQIKGHETKRFIGKSDIPLDNKGRNQAVTWHESFASLNFDMIYSSSMERCRRTAQIICPNQDIRINQRLNEIDMGDWDGKTFAEIKKKKSEAFKKRGENMYKFRPSKGESFQDLLKRILPFFNALETKQQNLTDKGKKTLVVTHSGVIRVLICHILNIDPEKLFKIKIEYSHLFVIHLHAKSMKNQASDLKRSTLFAGQLHQHESHFQNFHFQVPLLDF